MILLIASEARIVNMEPAKTVIVLARRYQKSSTLTLVPSDTTLPLLKFVLVPFNLSRPDFPLKKATSFNTEAPRSRSAAPPSFQLAAHTDGANTLAERLFHGKISQKDYDVHIYSTTISSMNRVTSVPITLTMEDSLATLIAYAHQIFRIPLANVETTKLYVLWSEKVFGTIGSQSVPENLNSLDQDTLHMVFIFMKASPQVEQLFIRFENHTAESAVEPESTTTEAYQAAAENDILAPKDAKSYSLNATDRGCLGRKEQSTSRKRKKRERPTGHDRNAQDSVQGDPHNLALVFNEDKPQVSHGKQEDTQQAPPAKGESRKPESASGALKGSVKCDL